MKRISLPKELLEKITEKIAREHNTIIDKVEIKSTMIMSFGLIRVGYNIMGKGFFTGLYKQTMPS